MNAKTEAMIKEALALRARGLMYSLDGSGRVEKTVKSNEEGDMKFQLFKDGDREGVDKQAYEEPSGKRPRIDGKAKGEPADDEDDDQMSPADRKARGIRRKAVSGNDPFLNPGSNYAARTFDIGETSRGGLRPADAGEDRLGRPFDDGAYTRLGGLNDRQPETSPVPRAGAGETWEGDTRDAAYRPAQFLDSRDGAYIGGDEKPHAPARPNLGADGSYSLEEIGQVGDVAVRSGPNFILAPIDPGIAPAADFVAPSPVRKRRGGLFRSVLDDSSNLSGLAPDGAL